MHPGLETEKASELTEENLLEKISEIQKRMGIAYMTGRTDSIYQLQLLLDHYRAILQEKLIEEQNKMIEEDPNWGRKVIDIDWPDPKEDTNKKHKKVD